MLKHKPDSYGQWERDIERRARDRIALVEDDVIDECWQRVVGVAYVRQRWRLRECAVYDDVQHEVQNGHEGRQAQKKQRESQAQNALHAQRPVDGQQAFEREAYHCPRGGVACAREQSFVSVRAYSEVCKVELNTWTVITEMKM